MTPEEPTNYSGLRPPHPNDLDRKRIARALMARKRYRYVTPDVLGVDRGYRIESPCCSRNIDAEGGPVDIALIEFQEGSCGWRLYGKNHDRGIWEFHSSYDRLADLMDWLNADPERRFWQ